MHATACDITNAKSNQTMKVLSQGPAAVTTYPFWPFERNRISVFSTENNDKDAESVFQSKSGKNDESNQASQPAKVTCLVEGASPNGLALAKLLASRGWNIAMIYSNEAHQTAARLQQAVAGEGQQCLLIHGKSHDRAFAKRAVQEILDAFGRLDVFIDHSPPDVVPALLDFTMMAAALPTMTDRNP
jgi:hypothetical protein